MANRLRGAQRVRALTTTLAVPGGTRECSLLVIDLARGWSDTVGAQISFTDLLAMVASVYINVKTKPYTRARISPHSTSTLGYFYSADGRGSVKLSL